MSLSATVSRFLAMVRMTSASPLVFLPSIDPHEAFSLFEETLSRCIQPARQFDQQITGQDKDAAEE